MPAVIYIKTIVTQALYVNYLNTYVTNLHQCVGKFSQWNQFINTDKTVICSNSGLYLTCS